MDNKNVLFRPGIHGGTCNYDCEHASCKNQRELLKRECRLCGATIGYETRFFDEGETLVHEQCLPNHYSHAIPCEP
jgi:hypothetical protein